MEEVAAHWHDFAIALGFKPHIIKIIEQQTRCNPEDACREMFFRWLHGDKSLQPVTWKTVITSLRRINLNSLAEIVNEILITLS